MRFLISFLVIGTTMGCHDSLPPQAGSTTAGRSSGPPPTGAPPLGHLRLNELLASNRADRIDDEGQSSDWIELHNAGPQPLRLGGFRLTNDLKTLDKWTLPNHLVPAGGHCLVWMSGLRRVSLAPEALKASATTIPFETTLVPAGANWKYLAGSADEKATDQPSTPTGWTAVDFDDSQFSEGPAGFGYGDDDDATEFPAGTTVVLLRHAFTLTEPLASEAIVLQVDYDDGFVAYLNETRVAAVNAPPDKELGLNSTARGQREAGSPERFDLSKHARLLRTGKNVLAIAALNTHRGSSDMSLKPALGTIPTVLHANFRLNKSGDTIYLISPDGNIADQVRYPRQVPDQSLGRIASTRSNWGYFLTPSPGQSNSGPSQPQPVTARLSFTPPPGGCEPGTQVHIAPHSSTAVDIRFTHDGSNPTASSPLYRDPVTLDDTTLFRAAAFIDQEQVGQVVSATYLVGRRPDLPVLSISLKPEDFLDVHLQKSGKGRGSERPAFLEIFSPAGKRVVATGLGFRLHGGAGRRGGIETKKSYRLYFRKVYGEGRVEHAIIPEAKVKDFDKLVLRANFGDGRSHGAYIRDQVTRDLQTDMGGLASNGTWYILLINSDDHGVYNVVERMDEEFFISHLGPGQYEVIKTGNTVLSGTRKGWDELRDFISSTDFSNQDNYDELAKRVDIENFTSYVILNLWTLNLDWPHNNWYAARRIPDGKWIFLCWDAEWGLGGGPYRHDVDPYAFMDSGGAYGHGMSRKLFFALLGNPGYCEYYQKEVRRHLAGPLHPDNALRQTRRHRDRIATDIEYEFERRKYGKRRWHEQIAEVETFVRAAGKHLQASTDAYFSHRLSAGTEDRVAMAEDENGHRHVVHRTDDGHLHEFSLHPDGSREPDTSISQLAKSPPATGRPAIYTFGAKGRRVVYRDASGHLHVLSRSTAGSDAGTWRHADLTTEIGVPEAGCDPSVIVIDGVPHIFYADRRAALRELWFDGEWKHHALLAAPRPAGNIAVSRSAGTIHVTYVTAFGAACEQTLSLGELKTDRRSWRPRLIHRLPATGNPIGFSHQGKRRIVFRAPEKWPSHKPFYFAHEEKKRPDYRTYQGPRNTLVQATDVGQRFRRLEPIGSPPQQVAGNPCALHATPDGNHFLAFRDVSGQIQEAVLTNGSWQLTIPTKLTGAPPASGDPVGLLSTQNGSRYYLYPGREGHLHELSFNGSWSHRDLNMTAPLSP